MSTAPAVPSAELLPYLAEVPAPQIAKRQHGIYLRATSVSAARSHLSAYSVIGHPPVRWPPPSVEPGQRSLKKERMRPLTKQQRQPASEVNGSSISTPGMARRCPHESSVVVLGVMYPTAIPQRRKGTAADLPGLPPSAAAGRRNTDIVFFDPVSSSGSKELARECTLRADRREATKAVARDLAMLSLRQRECHSPVVQAT